MKVSISFRSFVVLMVLVGCSGVNSQAQATLPLVPGSPTPRTGEPLDVELIYISASGPMPGALRRKAGRFIVAVTNTNPNTMDAGFVIEPAAVGDLKLSKAPLLKLGGQVVSDQSHRSAALFDAPAGAFDLKDATTGKIICKFLLE